MKTIHALAWSLLGKCRLFQAHKKQARTLVTLALAALIVLLVGCQSLSAGITGHISKPTAVDSQARLSATATPRPTRTPRTLETLPSTYTPAASQPAAVSAVETAAVPGLLADFPLFSGAQILVDGLYSTEKSALMAIQTNKSPGELDDFYRKALPVRGWILRYAEGNVVGGFVQEWKKDKQILTVEYHFANGHPLVNADLRIVESNQALAMLLGFPLPNGSEVVRSAGSTIELYVPQDLDATVDFFKKQIEQQRWNFKVIDPTGWCGSLACQEIHSAENMAKVSLEPTPTPEPRQAEYYRLTLPDWTLTEISFLPHGNHTRVYININFKNLARAGLPVTLYPRSAVTALTPGVAMFEVKADIQDVIKFYENALIGMGWKMGYLQITRPDIYSRTWEKAPARGLSLSLVTKQGKVYGTITCSTCKDPYYRLPTGVPTQAPSR